MARTGAVFGGEHSAHYYFRDFWCADTGMLAALHVLAALGEQDRPLSELAAAYERYVASGEINSDGRRPGRPPPRRCGPATPTARGQPSTSSTGSPSTPATGGSTCAPSNTEPLLRLNVEAADARHDGRRSATRCCPRCAAAPPRPRTRRTDDVQLDPPAARDPGLPGLPLAAACGRGGEHGDELVCTRQLRAGLPGPRRHPGAARRRGPAPVNPLAGDRRRPSLDDLAAARSGSTRPGCCAPSPRRARRSGRRCCTSRPRRWLRLAEDGRPRAVVVAGMGGSGIAGDVPRRGRRAAAARSRCCRHRGHRLPGWVGAADLVVAVSCSGGTEETLSAAGRGAAPGRRLS